MKYILLLALFTIPHFAQAQISGEIIYEETINLHRRIPEERAEIKKMIPEFRSEKMILLFNDSEAVYQKYDDPNAEVVDDVDMSQNGRRRGGFRNMRSNQILYQNYQDDERIEQREFMDKKFLITGEPHRYAWKLEGETKNVGDYNALKASYTDSATTIIAWFVPDLAVPLGPGEYGQLPGLVLHVDINDGERVITAQSIDLRELGDGEISKPTKGKEMTNEEFRAMMKEKMKEMRGNRPGGMHMRTRRN